ncbi:hypothetical protein V2J09_007008 [Rumex salicifolius]
MILGYAYPALECFKTLEKNKVDMNDLRFWCQYCLAGYDFFLSILEFTDLILWKKPTACFSIAFKHFSVEFSSLATEFLFTKHLKSKGEITEIGIVGGIHQ